MTEIVKVFKNVHTQTATGAASSITLASTGATERAVIKDVDCKGVKNATLDLDGRTLLTSTTEEPDMVASGSLIMDTNSVLSLKFPTFLPAITPSFKGMFFSNGNDGINYFEGDGIGNGTSTSMTSITNLATASGKNAYSSFAAMNREGSSGTLTFFRYYGNIIYEYDGTSGSYLTSYGFGSGYGSCTDGTYMYSVPSASTSTIYRRHIVTGVNTTLYTTSGFYGQGGNQGSFLEYHDGHLYSKQYGSSSTMYVIKLSDLTVSNVGNGNLSGSYSDGGCIVTTVSGTSYVVETSTNQWGWYEIGGTATNFTKETGSSGASTEYGDGGVEVAPGIAMIFAEQSDDLTIIDMNQTPPAYQHIASASGRKLAVHDSFGNNFSACGFLVKGQDAESITYDAYTSGILIT